MADDRRVTDYIHQYRGCRGKDSRCRIRIYRTCGHRKIVVAASDLADNPGEPVEHSLEIAANQV